MPVLGVVHWRYDILTLMPHWPAEWRTHNATIYLPIKQLCYVIVESVFSHISHLSHHHICPWDIFPLPTRRYFPSCYPWCPFLWSSSSWSTTRSMFSHLKVFSGGPEFSHFGHTSVSSKMSFPISPEVRACARVPVPVLMCWFKADQHVLEWKWPQRKLSPLY